MHLSWVVAGSLSCTVKISAYSKEVDLPLWQEKKERKGKSKSKIRRDKEKVKDEKERTEN